MIKCPFRLERGKIGTAFADCIREECALWDERNRTCAIKSLSETLYGIYYYLAQLRHREY